MLPFLKPKAQVGLIVTHRASDGSKEESHSEGNEDHGLESCAEHFIRAIHAKDAKSVSEAFKAAFEILDSMPHDTPESESEE